MPYLHPHHEAYWLLFHLCNLPCVALWVRLSRILANRRIVFPDFLVVLEYFHLIKKIANSCDESQIPSHVESWAFSNISPGVACA